MTMNLPLSGQWKALFPKWPKTVVLGSTRQFHSRSSHCGALRCAHSFVRSLVCSLLRLPHTACLACALRCAHSFTHSLVFKSIKTMNCLRRFHLVSAHRALQSIHSRYGQSEAGNFFLQPISNENGDGTHLFLFWFTYWAADPIGDDVL